MKRHAQIAHNAAEMLAIQALAFIAGEPDRLKRFLDMSGIEADEIRAAAREVAFLAGVLEHMLGDESLLVAFADSAGIDPGEIARARVALDSPEGRKPP
jgi:Protein of unknown function (DUF3572)